MAKKKISIIIVNHNSEKYLLDCVGSIVKYGNPAQMEIIVVDNGSAVSGLGALKARFNDVIIIENKNNIGFASANNMAIRRASGEYLLLLNNDTLVFSDVIGALAEFANKYAKGGIIAPRIYEADGKTVQKNCRSFPQTPFDTMFGRASLLSKIFPNNPITKKTTLSEWDYNSPRQVDWVSGAAMMIRREVFDQIGLLDENFFMYWEDTDLCKRARDAGWEVWFTPAAEIIHFTGKGGGERPLGLRLYTMYQMHRSAYYYFRKHFYKNPFHPMAILTFAGMVVLIGLKSVIEISKRLLKIGR